MSLGCDGYVGWLVRPCLSAGQKTKKLDQEAGGEGGVKELKTRSKGNTHNRLFGGAWLW